ncbi:7041_t:CDS:2 [Acaulospora morrowiae]|uniref:7041_t:CDS:1 n=1 Tax=Acaulospora morrowiae TaxID=94023 RepID=A0A9N8YSL1_9GLOM|nr:7041_t:CDS:2 [Acaulospora morrowiae]
MSNWIRKQISEDEIHARPAFQINPNWQVPMSMELRDYLLKEKTNLDGSTVDADFGIPIITSILKVFHLLLHFRGGRGDIEIFVSFGHSSSIYCTTHMKEDERKRGSEEGSWVMTIDKNALQNLLGNSLPC